MKLEMRELKGDDLFVLLPIITKLNIHENLVALFEGSTQAMSVDKLEELKNKHTDKDELKQAIQLELEKVVKNRGVRVMSDLLVKVLSNIGLIRNDLNKLFADLCGISVKEVKELGLAEYTSLVVAFFKKPELSDFFQSLEPLMDSEEETGSKENID